jgi:DNA-binding NarL/FixJ family response regulator
MRNRLEQRCRVVIVDDNPGIRAVLRIMLADDSGIEVIGEAADGREAIRAVGQLAPDLALMDLNMPVMGGLEATAEIKRRYPGVRVVIVTMHKGQEYSGAIFEAGADGYVQKDASSSEFCTAIRSVMAGEIYGLKPGVC